MPDLKPCPFCGSTNVLDQKVWDGAKRYVKAECQTCGACAEVHDWNTRPIEDALRERIKELEGMLGIDVAHHDWFVKQSARGVIGTINHGRTTPITEETQS